MSQAVSVEQETTSSLQATLSQLNLTALPSEIIVYNIQGPFFFAAAETLEHTLSVTYMDPKAIIFRLKGVPFMDITGLQTFQEIIEQFHSRSIDVLLCEANSRVQYKLEKMDIFKWIYKGQAFTTLPEALQAILRIS